MSYSDLYLGNRTKYNYILLLAVPLVFVFSFWLFFKTPNTSVKAQKVGQSEIVNLSSTQAGIYWQTNPREMGWVIYGETENNLDKIAFDQRDLQEKKNLYLNHYVSLDNLKTNTNYYFKIMNNQQMITDVNNKAFHFQTLASNDGFSYSQPAYGKSQKTNGQPLDSGIVILRINEAHPQLTLTKVSGEWLIPLNKKILSDKDNINISIFDEDGGKTSIVTNIKNITPLPKTTIVGKDYKFTQDEKVLAATTVVNAEIKNYKDTLNILFPKEGALIPGSFPLISGIAIPGADVTISMNTKIFNPLTVKTDKNGKWSVPLSVSLPSEDYVLTVRSQDKIGKGITLKRKFTIAKSGEQVMGQATQSASPTSIPTATPTQIIELTSTPTNPVSGFDPKILTFSSGFLILLGVGLLLAF